MSKKKKKFVSCSHARVAICALRTWIKIQFTESALGLLRRLILWHRFTTVVPYQVAQLLVTLSFGLFDKRERGGMSRAMISPRLHEMVPSYVEVFNVASLATNEG